MKRALGITLASAALLTGCGTQTVGNSVVTPEGECLPGKTSFELAPDQKVFLGGDLKIGGVGGDEEGTQDNLQLQNTGKGVLEVSRSSGDEGELTFLGDGGGFAAGSSDDDHSFEASFGLEGRNATDDILGYSENNTTLRIGATAQGSAVVVNIVTTCNN
ncbi:MAG TPA: hypothetical protein VFW77_04720 [Candidatus Saccharimonadales bacterium]|nr:hypothetical protein [Candidatus Saccharimonadales bacterium]